jgi:octaprenyl-diphosphate synthase
MKARRAIPPGKMLRPAGPLPETDVAALPAVLEPVREDLVRVGAAYEGIVSDISWRSKDMVRHAARFVGKRLRPALTCIAARLAGRGVTDDGAVAAAIVEMIHTATLVHDDVLDDARVRRKVATLNARWGDRVAVLAGDVLFSRAYLAAARLEDRFASRYLSEVVGEVLDGEIHQDLVCRNPDLTEAEYRSIIRGKTAALYEAAMVVGVRYGGGPETLGQTLGRYGHHVGMAFQMVDDRLDLAGDEATVGKSLGRDLSEGKTTLPVILWLGGRPPADRAEARALVEASWDDTACAEDLAGRLVADGAIRAADAAAAAEIREAQRCLEALPEGSERSLLETIARYVISRSW